MKKMSMHYVVVTLIMGVMLGWIMRARRIHIARAWTKLDNKERLWFVVLVVAGVAYLVILSPTQSEIRESQRIGDTVALLSGYQAGMSREGAEAYSYYVREKAEAQLSSYHLSVEDDSLESEKIFWQSAQEYLAQHPEYQISEEEQESMHSTKAASISSTPHITILAHEPE